MTGTMPNQPQRYLTGLLNRGGKDMHYLCLLLLPDLEDGVIVYHINTTNRKAGDYENAEPFIDVEGIPYGTTEIVSMQQGDKLNTDDTSFYGKHLNGLSIDFLNIKVLPIIPNIFDPDGKAWGESASADQP